MAQLPFRESIRFVLGFLDSMRLIFGLVIGIILAYSAAFGGKIGRTRTFLRLPTMKMNRGTGGSVAEKRKVTKTNSKSKIDIKCDATETNKKTKTDEIRELAAKYGIAGVASLLFETILFNVVILAPLTLFTFHKHAGTYLPDLSNSMQMASFWSTLGGCYVLCKFPPIEAARWAWAFSITPWMERRLPERIREIDIEAMLNSETSESDASSYRDLGL